MKIGFDATSVIHPVGGISRYTKNLLGAIVELKNEDTVVGYIPVGARSQSEWSFDNYSDRVKWVEINPYTFRRRGAIDQLDLYHGTNFKLQTSGRYGTVLTIHDLWLDRHPEYSKKLFGQRFSFFRTRRRVLEANRVIAVSHFTALEIQDLYGISPEKISVIHHGVSSDFFPDLDKSKFIKLIQKYGLPTGPYILFLGGADPRKNHKTLFQSFAHHTHLSRTCNLIAVGSLESRGENLLQTSDSLGLKGKIYPVSTVSHEELRLLYSFAEVFVYPSRYEGFGFPVLEAMACGTPVITNKSTSLPEVAGDAAILVDAEDESALGESMLKVLEDPLLCETLKRKGLAHSQGFSWMKAAQKTLNVYREVCQG